jgi:signal transduction histidine kinase
MTWTVVKNRWLQYVMSPWMMCVVWAIAQYLHYHTMVTTTHMLYTDHFMIVWMLCVFSYQRCVQAQWLSIMCQWFRKTNPYQSSPTNVGAPKYATVFMDDVRAFLANLNYQIDRQTVFLSKTSHELRNPLERLQANLHLAIALPNAHEKITTLEKCLNIVHQCGRLVSQMLALGRVMHCTEAIYDVFDWHTLTAQTVKDCQYIIQKKNLSIVLESKPGLSGYGNPILLNIMLKNILENAIRYSPMNGTIYVTCHAIGRTIYLTIVDEGPGIPDLFKEKVFDKFFRESKEDHAGTGLGMAIIYEVVNLHKGSITLCDRQNHMPGLQVNASFPC